MLVPISALQYIVKKKFNVSDLVHWEAGRSPFQCITINVSASILIHQQILTRLDHWLLILSTPNPNVKNIFIFYIENTCQ